MAFFFVMGSRDFINPIAGHENLVVYCPNCHNVAVRPQKRLTMFTFCFVPVIPLGNKQQMRCTICNWHQDLQKGELEQIETAQRNRPQGGPPPPPPSGPGQNGPPK